MRERLGTASELPTTGAYLFVSPTEFDEKQAIKRLKKANLDQLSKVSEVLEAVTDWTSEAAVTQLKGWANENEVKLGVLLPLYRIALTGGMSGPDVFDSFGQVDMTISTDELNDFLDREVDDPKLKQWGFGAMMVSVVMAVQRSRHRLTASQSFM